MVASVGRTAITASDVQNEYRLELFLESRPASTEPTAVVLNQVRGRVVDRILLQEEAQSSEIQVDADDQSVTDRMREARDKFPTERTYLDALGAAGMSEDDLRRHFANQAAILLLIDRRLRPEAAVDPSEIEAYYRGTFIPEMQQKQNQPPALDDVEDRIREILTQKKINILLDAWLERLRAEREVKLYGGASAEGKP